MSINRAVNRDEILTNETGDVMLDMVAPVYDRSKLALYLFQAFGVVLEQEQEFIMYDFIDQIFIQTATWGLDAWEQEYNIVPDPSWTYEQRRQNIIATLQYTAPITPIKIANRITGLVGIQSTAEESKKYPNTMDIVVRGYLRDHSKAKEMIDKVLPAHLSYDLKAHYVVDSMLTNHYAITASKCESINAGLENETGNDHDRIADENDVILLDENMHVLVYTGEVETNDEFTLVDEEGNILLDQEGFYLVHKDGGD